MPVSDSLVAFRQDLHRHPEVSGEEAATADRVAEFLVSTRPDAVFRGLGGHGLAVVYEGKAPGPTVMLRAELDALPIAERPGPAHRSEAEGRSHACGHDGHMAILAGVGCELGRRRPARGRAVLLFQPAEETGAGAAAVIADPAFAPLRPDLVLALHNMPGVPLGVAGLREGLVMCASRGLRILLGGWTAHASAPETGRSPMAALARLMPALTDLSAGDPTQADFALATITHCVMGEPTFGVAPGEAEIRVTLRTLADSRMEALVAAAEGVAGVIAAEEGLTLAFETHDVFQACDNHPEAVGVLRRALPAAGLSIDDRHAPIRASEDFGRFGTLAPSAMLFLGAGEGHPALHNPDYDFPDGLIEPGVRLFLEALRDRLG